MSTADFLGSNQIPITSNEGMFKSVLMLAVWLTWGFPSNGATLPPELKRVAAFIVTREGTNVFPIGTCFSVGVRDPKVTNLVFNYLVTAKHVLVATNSMLRSNLWVRVNRLKGGVELLPLSVGTIQPRIFFHTNDSVDIGVVEGGPRESDFDLPMLHAESLAGKDSVTSGRIIEGDEVFFPGLFTPYYGSSNNIPVFRFGRISILPNEPLLWNGKMCELYLIETTCFGGNSGAPVFVRYAADRIPGSISLGPGDIFLAGVLIGYFNDLKPIAWANSAAEPYYANNTGISAVVPAHLIREILYSPEVRKSRGE